MKWWCPYFLLNRSRSKFSRETDQAASNLGIWCDCDSYEPNLSQLSRWISHQTVALAHWRLNLNLSSSQSNSYENSLITQSAIINILKLLKVNCRFLGNAPRQLIERKGIHRLVGDNKNLSSTQPWIALKPSSLILFPSIDAFKTEQV